MSDALKAKLLETEIARQMPDLVSPNAVDYIQSLAKSWYEIDDAGAFQPTNAAPLNRDAKPLPVTELGAMLRLSHGYLFKPQAPAGTEPAKPKYKPRYSMTIAEKAQAMKELTPEQYLALPATAEEATPLLEKRRSTMSVSDKAAAMKILGDRYLDLPW
ncbi:MAG TPA: hypothetical protein VHR86_08800 [Armatimonadota bacterium]|nr:hypothetical protein [Armatimonadota bacterium]